MKIPKFLKQGDTVAIICPASFLRGDLAVGVAILESWGLQVRLGETVKASYHQFAGDDRLRAKDLQWALDDPTIQAVFAARGGYGTVRIIDEVDFSNFQRNPKWIIGFSDITVLHAHINRQYGIPTIHGQMPKSFEEGSPESLETLRQSLFGENVSYSYRQRVFPNVVGTCSGILVGGNLAILQSILASCSDLDYNGKILFIEDVGESYYTVDRMLWALKRAGKLQNLAGLIVGSFSSMKDANPSFGQSVHEIVWAHVKDYAYPVAFEFPAGHLPDNRALIFGKTVNLATSKNQVQLQYS